MRVEEGIFLAQKSYHRLKGVDHLSWNEFNKNVIKIEHYRWNIVRGKIKKTTWIEDIKWYFYLLYFWFNNVGLISIWLERNDFFLHRDFSFSHWITIFTIMRDLSSIFSISCSMQRTITNQSKTIIKHLSFIQWTLLFQHKINRNGFSREW